MMGVRRVHQTVVAVEIAFACDAPVHAFQIAGRKYIVPLSAFQRRQGRFAMLHHVVNQQFLHDLPALFTKLLQVHVLHAVAVKQIHERLFLQEMRAFVPVLSVLRLNRVGQLFYPRNA